MHHIRFPLRLSISDCAGELTALQTSLDGFSVRRGYQGRTGREEKGREGMS